MLQVVQLVSILKSDGVAVLPTDTVYGLVCSALSPDAVRKMYEIKQREGKPGTILAGSIRQLTDMGFDEGQVMQASLHWPAATSVVLDAPESLEYLHMGMNSLAVRIPRPKWLRDLLNTTGPLATTSANLPRCPTVTNSKDAEKIFDDKVGLYVDGGTIKDVKPSTIIRIRIDGSVEKLRD